MEDKAPVRLPPCGTVTIAEFWETTQRNGYMEPEKYLMLAVLKDALLDYRNNLTLQNKRFKCARTWFFDELSNRLFSFESICEVLNVSPSYIRQELVGLANRGSPAQRHAA
jgi:hypothetical protein